ncbi:OmpA family protein [Soonwooa purpurea]
MRKIYILFLICASFLFSKAQYYGDFDNSFKIGINAGIDMPSLDNKTPFINYKPGVNIGVNLDYFWTWFGLGADFNYISNATESTYPSDNLFLNTIKLNNIKLDKHPINRLFIGIGPNFKHEFSDEFSAIFKLRGGISTLKNGEVQQYVDQANRIDLNSHNSYDIKNIASAKAQLEFNYFFTENLGLNFGAYYLQHFQVKENGSGNIAGYRPFTENNGQNNVEQNYQVRGSLEHEAHSVGAFAGLVYRFGNSYTSKKSKTTSYPYKLEVIVKDKYTDEALPNAEVLLINSQGQRAYYGTSNKEGKITFNNVKPDDYELKGKFRDITLVSKRVEKTTLITLIPMKMDLENEDERFIIEGKVSDCNTKKTLPYASVSLKNETTSEVRNLKTSANGTFSFMAKKDELYSIYGKKGNYFSQTENLDGKLNDRTKKLFLNLQVCMEEATCDKAINLQNINYDFDKTEIRNDAKPELDKLYQFLTDNPSVKLELSSHTDSRGSDDYNLKLSQGRADSAVNYLVSKGLSRNRIVAKGYGETKLLNECYNDANCTEDQHQQNRRTEFKVICAK